MRVFASRQDRRSLFALTGLMSSVWLALAALPSLSESRARLDNWQLALAAAVAWLCAMAMLWLCVCVVALLTNHMERRKQRTLAHRAART